MSVTSSEYLRLHVEAEFTHDADGRLVRVNERAGGPAPRFWLGRATDGTILRRYRHDVPHAVRRELDSASTSERVLALSQNIALDATPYAAILERAAPVNNVSSGLAYCFPVEITPGQSVSSARRLESADAGLLVPLLAEWVPDLENSQPLIAVIVDGRATAVCASVRITPHAHEAGVETAVEYRGRGCAPAAVAAWGAAVRDRGAEPIYSTSWQNTASQAVARKLGLLCVGSDLHIT